MLSIYKHTFFSSQRALARSELADPATSFTPANEALGETARLKLEAGLESCSASHRKGDESMQGSHRLRISACCGRFDGDDRVEDLACYD